MRPQQKWLEEEGIVWTGFWEPDHYIRHMGSATQNTASRLDFIKSEEWVKHLAGLGINQLWSNFSKGYGLKFEDEEQQKIKRMCEYAHKHNIRVIAYCTGGSLTPETVKFDLDDPDSIESWLARTEDGKLCSYGCGSHLNFRARPCYTSDGYMDWQKKVIKKALDFGCDAIHFDNTQMLPEPNSCKCERCVKLFRAFVVSKYSGDEDKEKVALLRWGRTDLQYTKEPWYDQYNHAVLQRELRVANQQEWALFRMKTFSDAMIAWADYIHELGGAVEYNCGKGFGSNYRVYHGIDDDRILPHADIAFNEGVTKSWYSANGTPHTRIRELKIAQAYDLPLMTYNKDTLRYAEAFSFNPGILGQLGQHDRPEEIQDRLKFIQFYHKNKAYQTQQTSLAETAFFLHKESLTFSQLEVYLSNCALTQLFQEERVPFNMIYEKDLGDLSQYRLIVVSDMHVLHERQAKPLMDWVRAGGRLLTVGRTGMYDDHFQIRTRVKEVRCAEDLYNSGRRENVFTPLSGEDHTKDFIKKVDAGMVAHIAELEYEERPATGDPASWNIPAGLIRKPKNSDMVMSYVNTLLPHRNLRVVSTQDLLVDLCRRKDTGEGLVHVLNVSFANSEMASARVTVRWSEEVKTLTWIGFDRADTAVPFERHGESVTFELADIRESAVVVINKQ